MNLRINLIFALLLLPAGVFAQFKFIDATDSCKIDQQSNGTQNVGPGVIVFDIDNDGWEDLYLAGGSNPDKLYRNMHDGTFMDIADSAFRKHAFFSVNTRGGTAFDFDNDGWTDIYQCSQSNDLLWKNNGNGTFTSVGTQVGLVPVLEQNQSNGASFGDFDGDGDNDFYVARWINELKFIENPDPKISGYAHKGFPNWFYINNGNGTFTERAKEYGVDGDTGCSNIVVFFDYDRDGDLDLLVGNDFGVEIMPNRVWKNMLMETGSATNERFDTAIGLEQHLFCMSITPNDYDRDGDFDFFETSVGPMCLMQNNNNIFTNASVGAHIPDGFMSPTNDTMTTTWTGLFTDFDNDGWEDLFIVHGYIQTVAPWIAMKKDTSSFLWNKGGTFEDVTKTTGVITDVRGKGGALIDYDRDGKVDIAFGSMANIVLSTPPKDFKIFHNITSNANNGHWLQINCKAIRTAREAIGTIVDVWSGGIVHSKQISTGGGQASCNSLTAFIGMGKLVKADSIVIYWPADKYRNRTVNRYYNVSSDQAITYTEDTIHTSTRDVSGVHTNNEKINVYPSPVHNTLYVEHISGLQKTRFEIFDLLGIKKADITGAEGIQPLSVANLLPGCYMLRISANGSSTIRQFIKE